MSHHLLFPFFQEFFLFPPKTFPTEQYCAQYDQVPPSLARLGLKLGLKEFLYYNMSLIKITMR